MHFISFFSCGIFLILFGCAGYYTGDASQFSLQDGKYDSEYPNKPTSEALKSISRSVYQLSSLTFYRQYHFTETQQVTENSILDKNNTIESLAYSSYIIEKPAAGTATVIYYQAKKVGLLTCAHTVAKADTIIRFFLDVNGNKTPFIELVDVKLRQSLNVIGLPAGEDVEILAVDEQTDLAILGKRLSTIPFRPIAVFKYPFGRAQELEMGVFVYLIGFPHGKKMVMSSIVSAEVGSKNNFIINATMHNGVSGGIVLAIRDGAPHFELVGIVNALSAHHQVVLKPEPTIKSEDVIPNQPYQGNVYLDEQVQIIGGISFAIPVETIKKFLETHRQSLEKKGYFIEH